MVTSASAGSSPASLSPSTTSPKLLSGRVITRKLPSSFSSTSSAPASRAASISFSSSTPGSKKISPRLVNRNATEPLVPRLPPNLEKAWRTSDTVRLTLSVMVSTSTATPFLP